MYVFVYCICAIIASNLLFVIWQMKRLPCSLVIDYVGTPSRCKCHKLVNSSCKRSLFSDLRLRSTIRMGQINPFYEENFCQTTEELVLYFEVSQRNLVTYRSFYLRWHQSSTSWYSTISRRPFCFVLVSSQKRNFWIMPLKKNKKKTNKSLLSTISDGGG